MLNISVVGAGRVGTTLAVMLYRRRHRIVSVVSRSLETARALARIVRCKNPTNQLSGLARETNLVMIATPDDAVHRVSLGLAEVEGLEFARLSAFQTSGALTSDVLRPLAEKGSAVFSLHPVQTFAKKVPLRRQLEMMRDVWYGFEGDSRGVTTARRVVRDCGGKLFVVPKEQKILYHLACVFASNYPVALIGAVEELAAGICREGIAPFHKLVDASVRNALETGAGRALTGPIIRGDIEVLQLHMRELSRKTPGLLPLYSALGMYALELGRRGGALTDEQIRGMSNILSGQHDR